MQLRFPWILSRKRLVAASAADGVLFALLYFVLYELRFGVWPGLSLRIAALLVIWSLSSYVIGRYSGRASSGHELHALNRVCRQLIATLFVLTLTLGITLFHIWLFNKDPVQASYRSFLIPFLGSLAVFSPLLLLLLSRLFELKDLDNTVWSYVGSEEGFQQLRGMLKLSRVPVRLEHVPPLRIRCSTSSQFVVDHFYDHSSVLLSNLYRFQQQGAVILSRLSWCELVLERFPSELLAESDLLDGCFCVQNGTLQNRVKRVGDLVVALCLLVVTSPLLLASALLIKISDGGPVFYTQVRTGLYGNPFKIWKLRSMRIDAELQGAQWSSRSDSRITRVGSILRRTRLDELPQLWCVLTGSMSLIGPRPERPEFDQFLSRKIPNYELRHLIRPGLSGWAQVNYPYGASVEDSANKLSYDLFYLKNFSFMLDLLILFKTIRLVFNARGALPNILDDASGTL